MHTEFIMGNEAMALGAMAAGVNMVCGYPGTPSTEVLETIATANPGHIHVEWSVNEKAALEVASGAAFAGARCLVTMKQVGLNVASDPLMSLAYLGVKGSLVVLVADDPGPISSQTEQDTRTFGMYSKLPVFDPSSVSEAYEMIQDAFALSERYSTPVIMRPTTRIDHGYASIEIKDEDEWKECVPAGFVKDSSRWVIFPRLSLANHGKIEDRNLSLEDELSGYEKNRIYSETGSLSGSGLGIVSGGITFSYLMDALRGEDRPRILKISTPFPFPTALATEFLEGLDQVLVLEELDPVLERSIAYVCGMKGISVRIKGKLSGDVKRAGENTPDEIYAITAAFLGRATAPSPSGGSDVPTLPVRPPVLCAGCPHRASFYAVKQAMKGEKTIFCGDIGCYTLGNAKPLDMCDTCLCMGAGLGIAQGVYHMEKDTKCFAFVGDSTFFASGISGVVNGLYNQADMTLVILDNSTTAMTGHQPHPGTGITMMGDVVESIDMESLLRGAGIDVVETVNPMDHKLAVEVVRRVSEKPGIKAVIFRYPCVMKLKAANEAARIDTSKCVSCKKCINELGCPALIIKDGSVTIDESVCTGCTLCSQICPTGAIEGGGNHAPERKPEKKPGGSPVKNIRSDPGASATAEKPAGFTDRNILMCGVGGQGTVLASKLIADAAMSCGISVKTAETIGMAQRGGSVFSFLRLGESAFSPIFAKGQADLIIGFEPGEAVRMLPYLKEEGTVICSMRPVIPVSSMVGGPVYDVEAVLDYLRSVVKNLYLADTEKELRELGSEKVMNMLLLGKAARSGALALPAQAVKEAMLRRLPEKLHEINLRAFEL